jgi:F-type H+-transporting ATPase subunit b
MQSAIAYIRKMRATVLTVALLAVVGLALAHPAFAVDSPNEPDLNPSLTKVEDHAPAAGEAASAEHGAEGTDAAAHGGEHKSGGLPQLDFTTYTPQLFWMAIIFLVLFLVMSQKALPDIGSIVEGRRNLIDTNLKAAEGARAQADGIRASYEKNIETARMNAIKAVQDVELAAKKKAADQADAFRKKAEDSIKSAEERVLAQKDKAMGEMKNVAAEVASVAAEKITGVGTDMQKAKAIVDSIAGKAKAA